MRRGRWRVRQRRGVGRDPVGHGLLDHAQVARNAPQAHAVDVEADRVAGGLIIAARLGLGSVFALAIYAQVALAP